MTFAAFLLGMVGPLVIRAFIALGFTAITYTGVTAIVSALVSTAQSNWAALPAGALQLATLSGIPQGLGVVFGAYAALYAIRTAAGFTKYIAKRPG